MPIERVSDKGKTKVQDTIKTKDFTRINSERLELDTKRDFLKGGGWNMAQSYIQQFSDTTKAQIVDALETEGRHVSDPNIRPILKEYARLLKIPEDTSTSIYQEDDQAEASSQHGQGDQTKSYDENFASMSQDVLGIKLAEKLYERHGSSDARIKYKSDVRAYCLNARILNNEGYNAAYSKIEELTDEYKQQQSLKKSLKNYKT